jgi:hypothetical protein
MAGVHGVDKCDDLGTSYLANHDAIRAKSKSGYEQVLKGDFPRPVG